MANTEYNPGASNATDFQPPTRNPQTNGSNLQPSSTAVQSGNTTGPANQSQLQSNGQALSVSTGQSKDGSIPPFVSQNHHTAFAVAAIVIVVVVLFMATRRKRRPATRRGRNAMAQVEAEIAEARATAAAEAVVMQTSAKKAAKKHRKNRKKK